MLEEQLAAAAAASRSAELQRQQELARALEVERVREREIAIRQLETERQAMCIEDSLIQAHRAHQAAEERRCAEQQAMIKEDMHGHGLRREARARQRFLESCEKEFNVMKMEHRLKVKEIERQHEDTERERRRRAAEAERQEIQMKIAREKAAEQVLAQQRKAQAIDARRLAEGIAAEHRQAHEEARRQNEMRAEEDRKFEKLYMQNRRLLAECRGQEAKLTSFPSGVKCDAAEIAAFAQKLSELSPACDIGVLELDETATFFTES
jgi:fused signal recognition particle receptor